MILRELFAVTDPKTRVTFGNVKDTPLGDVKFSDIMGSMDCFLFQIKVEENTLIIE